MRWAGARSGMSERLKGIIDTVWGDILTAGLDELRRGGGVETGLYMLL